MSVVFGAVSSEDQYKCDVFVIMPFKDEYRDVYEHAIKEACEVLNLTVKLGDDFFSNQQIVNEIWSAINNCQLIIADCTEQNANVFYELGIAHCLEKNTIQITKQEQNVPFDIRGRRYIPYSTNTLAAGKKLKNDLRDAITKMLNLKSSVPVLPPKTDYVHPLQQQDSKRFELSKTSDPKILEKESNKARQSDEYDWMELFAEAWTRIEPGSIDAYQDLGKALVRSRQPKRAIPVGKKLTELNKLDHHGYQILGEAYSLLAEWDEARKWQEIALRYAPLSFKSTILTQLSETFEALGLVDEAITALEQLLPLLADDFLKQYHGKRLVRLKTIRGE